jgi:hypothetical protein
MIPVIPPKTRNIIGPIIRQQFCELSELCLYELLRGVVVRNKVTVCVWTKVIARLDPIFVARINELCNHILAVRAVHYRIVAEFGVPKSKTTLMVGRKTYFLGTESDCCLHPLIRTKIGGVEQSRWKASSVTHTIVLRVVDNVKLVHGEMHELCQSIRS